MSEFIAEIPSNRYGDVDQCLRLIREAARVGCTGVRFPLFRIEQLFAPQILRVSPTHRLRRRHELPRRFLPLLSACAREHGLRFGITPHDLDAVDAARSHVDFLAVSSHELPWLDLVHQCADTGLPLIIGTAMADAGETWNAIETALEAGCTDLTMVHGVASDPALEEHCNLAAIGTLRELLVREFAPLYPKVTLKAGWSDRSVSAGVIARAVNHWGCDLIAFHLDPTDPGGNPTGGYYWQPDRIAEVIAGGYLPVRRECDGTGRIAPGVGELEDRSWRADPGDGLRPNQAVRKSWPATQTEATRKGPDVYLVPDGVGLGHVARCLALAESLRDDHDADVLFLIRGTAQQALLLERHGFNWAQFESLDDVTDQVTFLNNITAATGPPVCVLDLQMPADDLARHLRRGGALTVVIDQPECPEMDLGIVPVFGWENVADHPNLVGGTRYLLFRDDITAMRSWQPTPGTGGPFPRIVVSFGAADPNDLTTRTVSALHEVMPQGHVQVVLNPATERYDLVSEILEHRFPGYEVISSGDPVEPVLAAGDVLITATGITVGESLCLGVPALVLGNYPADAEIVAQLADSGAVVDLGFHDDVNDVELTTLLRGVFTDPDRLSRLRFHAQELAGGIVDGHGAARAADRICKLWR